MSLVTPDTGLLFWMVIIFGIVFFILAKFGFPVITKMVNERTESINKSLAMAEEARGELANLNKEQAELLLQAKKERARIMDDAAKMKASIIEQAKAQAQEEASKVLEQARLEIAGASERHGKRIAGYPQGSRNAVNECFRKDFEVRLCLRRRSEAIC